MGVRLAVAGLVNDVFTNVQVNMAAGARRKKTWAYFLTNRKLLPIHSESEPRSRSKASTYT